MSGRRSRSTLRIAWRLALTSSLALIVWAATFAVAVSILSSGAPVAMAKPPKGAANADPDGIQITWDARTETVTVNWKAQSGSGVSKVTVYIVVYRNDVPQSWREYSYEYKAPYQKTQSGVSTWSDAPAASGDTVWARLLVYSPKSGTPVSDTNDALPIP
ncbi:MAG: hypothetical protein QW057_02160 [Candidatus Bathyarchaeia archaeon]